MDDFLAVLQEAVELKASLLKSESELWQKIGQAVNAYAKSWQRMQQATQATPPMPQAPASPLNRKPTNPAYLSVKEAARYVNMSASVLDHWRMSGNGPPYIKMGRSVRYRTSDLDVFIAERMFKHTTSYFLKQSEGL